MADPLAILRTYIGPVAALAFKTCADPTLSLGFLADDELRAHRKDTSGKITHSSYGLLIGRYLSVSRSALLHCQALLDSHILLP